MTMEQEHPALRLVSREQPEREPEEAAAAPVVLLASPDLALGAAPPGGRRGRVRLLLFIWAASMLALIGLWVPLTIPAAGAWALEHKGVVWTLYFVAYGFFWLGWICRR